MLLTKKIIDSALRTIKSNYILISITLLGIAIRTFNLHDTFFFGYDQARDLHEVWKILVEKNIKIVGPNTDIPGLFNGVLFYYFLAIPYFIGNFDPNFAVYIISILNVLGIIIIYFFGKDIGGKNLGLISAFLWAISYELSNYSRFISNASFIPLFSMIFFYGIYKYYVQRKRLGLLISIIGYGLAVQADFYLIYLGICYFLCDLFYKPKYLVKSLLLPIIVFIGLISSFIGAEIKFSFLGTHSLLNYFSISSEFVSIFDMLALYVKSFSKTIYYSYFSFNNFHALVLFVFLLGYLWIKSSEKSKIKFLVLYLFSTLPLFGFLGTNVVSGEYIHGSIIGATTLIVSYAFVTIYNSTRKLYGIILIGVILVSNLLLFVRNNFESSSILAYQPMLYSNQKATIDYTYQRAHGMPFSICTISNPLFVNTLWSTMFKIYGESKYGYLPSWSGPYQENFNTFFDYKQEDIMFLIVEPSHQIPEEAYQTTIYLADEKTVKVEEKTFGEIIVQKRDPINSKPITNTQKLSAEEIQQVKFISNIDQRYQCFFR